MSRDTFMKELEFLLQDVAEEDKADAVQYYKDYLDEAGPEMEEEIIKEFGSPERIAAMIRADLAGSLEEGGEFTDSGYQDERFKEPNFQVAKRLDLPEYEGLKGKRFYQSNPKEPRKGEHKVLRGILIVLLVIIAAPMALGIGGGMIGILAGIFGVLAALFFGLGLFTLAAGLGGVMLLVLAVVCAAAEPFGALVSAGAGIIALGLFFLGIAVSVLFYGKLIPALVRAVIEPISRFVNGRRAV